MTLRQELRHLAHAKGWDTEFAALQKVAPKLDNMKAGIFQALLQAGDDGLTPDEHCDNIGGLINTVRRRFTDMWQEGVIRHHPEGKSRLNSDNNPCTVWVIGRDEEAVRKARESKTLRGKIHGLEREVQRLTEENETLRGRVQRLKKRLNGLHAQD